MECTMTPSSSMALAACLALILSASSAHAGSVAPLASTSISVVPAPVSARGAGHMPRLERRFAKQAHGFTFLMPEAPAPTDVADIVPMDQSRAAVPQPLVIHAPVVVHQCVEPRIYELRSARRAWTQPRLIYGMQPACGTLARMAAVMPLRRGPRVVTIAE